MRTFAYLINYSQANKILPSIFSKLFLGPASSFSRDLAIKNVSFGDGKKIEGFFILAPRIPPASAGRETFIMDKIVSAVEVSEKLGAGILGLGGYASPLCEKGYSVFRKLAVPVTGGSALISWSAFEGVYRIARSRKIGLAECTLSIIGAANAVGSLCARKFCGYVAKLVLNADDEHKAALLKEAVLHLKPMQVDIENDASKAVKDADIVILCDSGVSLNPDNLKKGAIVCDASTMEESKSGLSNPVDAIFFTAGYIKIPHEVKFRLNKEMPKDVIPASLAETILLALEGKLVNYSVGENVNLDKMEEIADIAVKHGFEVWVPQAPLI